MESGTTGNIYVCTHFVNSDTTDWGWRHCDLPVVVSVNGERVKLMRILPLIVAGVAIFGQSQPSKLSDQRDAFKKKMMPSVGKVVTVTGELSVGKISEFVGTDDGGAVYIRTPKSTDIQKGEELYRQFHRKRIAVTGKLQFADEVVPKNPDGSIRTDVTRIPEHFYMDIADAAIRPAGHER